MNYNIDNEYFINVNSFKKSYNLTNIILNASECYSKMRFWNRCVLASANGYLELTIPLQNGRNQRCELGQVKMVEDGAWRRQHLRAMETCYARSPFWEHYAPELKVLFEVDEVSLFRFNTHILEWLMKKTKCNAKLAVTEGLDRNATEKAELGAESEKLRPNNYKLVEGTKPYIQVFSEKNGFLKNVSTLDLLMNLGPQAANYLAG
ncbi:MAG: hypothetical protein EAZ47_06775 [Bacteroidetes bacterium]|nr:MAG: hypothetical protein EAY72_04365 [Bacteroidota bacterium]TAE64320.1 MAG: hypothetical protein EAY68_07225 [Bacteroidota bacterium]TAF93342.1 MAG: hypothetical protein EAZ47_06775 [Bacteroidota bacterium]